MFGIICRLAVKWSQIPFYDVIRNMVCSNKRWRQMWFEPWQEKGVLKKMINGNVSSDWFYYDLQVCSKLQALPKTVSCLWYYTYKKYKNGNSARRTSTQRHIRQSICHDRSDNFSSGISGKLPKIARKIFSWERLIILMQKKKFKPYGIFQNCVISTGFLNEFLFCQWQSVSETNLYT